MKNLMVTLALVVGLLSTSVSFADEISSTEKAQAQHLSAFDGVETNLASNSELDNVSGEFWPLLVGGALFLAGTYYGGYNQSKCGNPIYCR